MRGNHPNSCNSKLMATRTISYKTSIAQPLRPSESRTNPRHTTASTVITTCSSSARPGLNRLAPLTESMTTPEPASTSEALPSLLTLSRTRMTATSRSAPPTSCDPRQRNGRDDSHPHLLPMPSLPRGQSLGSRPNAQTRRATRTRAKRRRVCLSSAPSLHALLQPRRHPVIKLNWLPPLLPNAATSTSTRAKHGQKRIKKFFHLRPHRPLPLHRLHRKAYRRPEMPLATNSCVGANKSPTSSGVTKTQPPLPRTPLHNPPPRDWAQNSRKVLENDLASSNQFGSIYVLEAATLTDVMQLIECEPDGPPREDDVQPAAGASVQPVPILVSGTSAIFF